mgnify:CR=1 FL=1
MSAATRRIHDHWSMLGALNRLCDGACIVAGLAVAFWIRPGWPLEPYYLAAALAIIGFYLLAELTGLYRSWRAAAAEQELFCVLLTWALTFPLLLAAGFATKHSEVFSRLSVTLWAIAAPTLICTMRLAIRSALHMLRARGFNSRNCAIVGVNDLSLQLVRNIEATPELGLKVCGFYDDRAAERTPELPDEVGQRLGDLDTLVGEARRGHVQSIYVTFPMRAEERIRELLVRLSDTTASVYIVPDFFVFELLHSRWTSVSGLPAVSVFENPLVGFGGALKRLMDIALATATLVVLAVPMACLALAVKLSSPGPIFFRQRRYGLDGREILVWKFRTMRVCEDGPQVAQATKDDPRVTRLGAIMRKTSLDELPQLFNVLGGSMSLVGPRPHANAHNELYRQSIPGYMLRHKVRPGITGLAQVNGWRGETDTLEKMERRIECDHRYIREWSLWLDLKILLKTFFVVFSRQNAY